MTKEERTYEQIQKAQELEEVERVFSELYPSYESRWVKTTDVDISAGVQEAALSGEKKKRRISLEQDADTLEKLISTLNSFIENSTDPDFKGMENKIVAIEEKARKLEERIEGIS